MGAHSYPDEERTIHQGQSHPSTTSKIFRAICMVLLFSMCLAMTGGVVLGIVALTTSLSTNAPQDDAPQVHKLLARSYYGNITASGIFGPTGAAPVSMNITASGIVGPTGTAPVSMNITASGNVGPTGTSPVSMNNVTVAMSTATGVFSSSSSPSLTLTVNDVDVAETTSPDVGAPAVNATVTITSTSTTVTNTRTVTQAAGVTADAVESSSEGSNTSVIVAEPADDCVPATVTLTVTKDVGNGPSAQMASTSMVVAPFTTLVIPDLYSKEVKVGQPSLSTPALNATTETAVIQEASETPAASNNLTTTIIVFEQPTVMVTSTKMLDDKMSSGPAVSTGPVDRNDSPCMSGNVTADAAPSMATVTLSKVITETYTKTLGGSAALTTGVRTVFDTEVVGVEKTVFASGTVGVLNNTSTAIKTITVQPGPPAPEATETAASNGTSPVIISEGSPSKLGKRSSGGVGGCVVMVVAATILCMLV